MKHAILLAITLSIFDVPSRPDRVVVEATCSDNSVVRVVVKRDELDASETLDWLTQILNLEHCN